MSRRRDLSAGILLAGLLLFLCAGFAFGAGWEGAEGAGWEESAAGRWNSLPEATVAAERGALHAKIALAPGTGVRWSKDVNDEPPAGGTLAVELTCSGTNSTSRDYDRYDSHFPLAVTAVYGKDSVDIPWKKRIAAFFRELLHGLPPDGIRLTYACGNAVPAGSMYRRGEEETVFILSSAEEQGKPVRSERDLVKDFRAAYGREPQGPVTGISVSAERPSKEQGTIETILSISSPLLR